MRKFILENSSIDHILVIDGGVFDGISVDNAVFVVIGGITTIKNFRIIYARPIGYSLSKKSETLISPIFDKDDKYFLFTGSTDKGYIKLWDKVNRKSKRLGTIANVNFGKQLRDRRKFHEDVISVEKLEDVIAPYKPCYTGRDVLRYYVTWNNLACLNDDSARRGGCWDASKQDSKNKLLTRQIGKYPEFAIDTQGYQCLNTLFMINLYEAINIEPYFVLGILNSNLIKALWIDKFYDKRRTFPKIKGAYLKNLPIYSINFDNSKDVSNYNSMVELVKEILELHKQLAAAKTTHDKTVIQRQIDATDNQIDQLVYELYGLTEEEIRVVEEVT